MTRPLRRTAALALSGLLAATAAGADWPTYQADAQHSGLTSSAVNPFNLTKSWSAPQGYGIPLIVGNTIYSMRNQQGIGSDVTTVRSFNLVTGAENWTYTNTFVFPSEPTYAGGSVLFAGQVGTSGTPQLYSLDAATGAQQYTVTLPSTIGTGGMPTVYTDPGTGARTAYVVASSSGGGSSVIGVQLGATSGSILWRQDKLNVGGTGVIPTVIGNSVIAVGPGKYYAFDRTTGAVNQFQNGNISGGGNATVVADAANNRFYVLESYSSSALTALTAYSYVNNSTITQLWQRTDSAIGSGGTPALGPDGKVYVASNSTLSELDPTTGATLRSITGRNFPNGVAPVLSNGKLWIYETVGFNNSVSAFDLNTFTFDRALTGGRGSLNSSFDGPGALTQLANGDGYFVLDYGNIYGQPGFDVYVVPEPSGLLLAAAAAGGVGLLARRRWRVKTTAVKL
jgi:hypothetical protein